MPVFGLTSCRYQDCLHKSLQNRCVNALRSNSLPHSSHCLFSSCCSLSPRGLCAIIAHILLHVPLQVRFRLLLVRNSALQTGHTTTLIGLMMVCIVLLCMRLAPHQQILVSLKGENTEYYQSHHLNNRICCLLCVGFRQKSHCFCH